jgi:murein DD-endopeptidase MepM/ murein hydrolase activator NlpD
MTPVKLAALGGSVIVLFIAVWLVFLVPPSTPGAPRATDVAALPSGSSATSGPSTPNGTPATAAPGATNQPSESLAPPNPLLKDVPSHSVDPKDLTGYIWPVKHAIISGRLAPRPADEGGFVVIDGVPYHDGLDLVTHCDDKVRAAHDGTVLYAGRNYDPYLGYQGDAQAIYDRLQKLGRTNEQAIVVVVDDGNGYRSVYVHLNEADVEQGAVIQAGDVIGLEGATGFASGCHLHYGLIRMDGAWEPVVERLLPFGYPPLVRERIDPLDVLPWGDPDAPQRLQDKVNPPSSTPISSTEPSTSPDSPTPTPEPSATSTTN